MATKRTEPTLPKRPSTLLKRSAVPASIRQRQDLERLLRVHDPDLVEKARARIKPAQLPLIRSIALDHALVGEAMVVKKHAVALLASLGHAEDLNLLADLARFDSEPSIRAEALMGLGRSGVEMAAPILVQATASRDFLEAAAASRALRILAQKAGVASVQAHVAKSTARAKKLAAAALVEPKRGAKTKARRQSQGDSSRSSRRAR
jgi:hypothetical protein